MSAQAAIGVFAILSIMLLTGSAVIHIEAARAYERGERS
jgi:hypothetical protein